jgi:elongation factor 1-gamma
MAKLHGVYGDAKTNAIQIVAKFCNVEIDLAPFDETIHLSESFK